MRQCLTGTRTKCLCVASLSFEFEGAADLVAAAVEVLGVDESRQGQSDA
jgi:hypothetical protein